MYTVMYILFVRNMPCSRLSQLFLRCDFSYFLFGDVMTIASWSDKNMVLY